MNEETPLERWTNVYVGTGPEKWELLSQNVALVIAGIAVAGLVFGIIGNDNIYDGLYYFCFTLAIACAQRLFCAWRIYSFAKDHEDLREVSSYFLPKVIGYAIAIVLLLYAGNKMI